MDQKPHRRGQTKNKGRRKTVVFALTDVEHRFVDCVAKGEEFDCAPNDGVTGDELDAIEDWENREIRAAVIVALCAGEIPNRSVHPRQGVRLRGAKIVGRVDLSRADLSKCPLAFHTCHFEEDVKLGQATIVDVAFTSCELPALTGDELNSSASLHLTNTHLDRISLKDASFRGVVELLAVRLSKPRGVALDCERMSAAEVTLGSRTCVKGAVKLVGAQIKGTVYCKGDGQGHTKLINPEDDMINPEDDTPPPKLALNCDRLNAGEVHLEKAHVEGKVFLVGAHLDGQLICNKGTKLNNPNRRALSCDGLNASDVLLENTVVQGEVSLTGAPIGGQLDFAGTQLINPNLRALSCQTLKATSVFLRDTTVEGAVDLSGAQISSSLSCEGKTTLTNPGYTALSARGCQIGDSFYFHLKKTKHGTIRARGTIDVSRCKVGRLDDDLDSWPKGSDWRERTPGAKVSDDYNLEGFSYYSLDGDEDVEKRLEWIRRSNPFSPDVYNQLAEVYRRSGEERHARKLALERERDRGRLRRKPRESPETATEGEAEQNTGGVPWNQGNLSWWGWVWHRLLGATVGYGYRPWLALIYFVGFLALGWGLFALPPAKEAMVPAPDINRGPVSAVPANAAAPCHDYPCFSPFFYTVDALVPFIDFHQESSAYWVPATDPLLWGWGWWNAIATLVLTALGWLVLAVVAAGFGSMLRRE